MPKSLPWVLETFVPSITVCDPHKRGPLQTKYAIKDRIVTAAGDTGTILETRVSAERVAHQAPIVRVYYIVDVDGYNDMGLHPIYTEDELSLLIEQ